MSRIDFYFPDTTSYHSYASSDNASLYFHSYGQTHTRQIKEDSYKFFSDNNVNLLDSGLLVPGLRYSSPGLVVFERPPTKKLVQYIDQTLETMSDPEEEQSPVCEYYIPVPWQVYIATYSMMPTSKYRLLSVRMYFASGPLNSVDTVLYAPYIHNFFVNGLLCAPHFDTLDEIERYSQNIQGVISSAHDWVWNTGFNRDLYECITETIKQTSKKNSIVRKLVKDYLHLGHNAVSNFYELISQYEPHDVLNETWANPSVTKFFQDDISYYTNLADNYLADHDIYYDEDEYHNEEESEENIYSRTPYYDMIMNPTKVVKTYKDILEYIKDPSLTDYPPFSTAPKITDVLYFGNAMINSSRFSS